MCELEQESCSLSFPVLLVFSLFWWLKGLSLLTSELRHSSVCTSILPAPSLQTPTRTPCTRSHHHGRKIHQSPGPRCQRLLLPQLVQRLLAMGFLVTSERQRNTTLQISEATGPSNHLGAACLRLFFFFFNKSAYVPEEVSCHSLLLEWLLKGST